MPDNRMRDFIRMQEVFFHLSLKRTMEDVLSSQKALPFPNEEKSVSPAPALDPGAVCGTVLRISDLEVSFRSGGRKIRVLDRVSIDLEKGRRLALLGETGCGKSVLAAAIFGLLPANSSVKGKIRGLGSENLLNASPKQLNRLRGRSMVLIPQNPKGSLNPGFRVQRQVAEAVRLAIGKKDQGTTLEKRVVDLLSKAGFDNPERVARMYPHQLSGGMAQRVLLAAGIAGEPDLAVADEPTKGLDPESVEQCLELLKRCFDRAALLLITHDLLAAAACHRAAVMYAGEIVEQGPAREVLETPRHPYTRGLVDAHPSKGLHPIFGQAHGFADIMDGCRFRHRCPEAEAICEKKRPELFFSGKRAWRCFHARV